MNIPRAIVGTHDRDNAKRTEWRFAWWAADAWQGVLVVRVEGEHSDPVWTCHVSRYDPELRAYYPVLVHPGEMPPDVGHIAKPLEAWLWGKDQWRTISEKYGVVLYEPGMVPSVPKEDPPKSFTDEEWEGHGGQSYMDRTNNQGR